MLTILGQDDTGGLELQRMDGTWVGVPPVERTFVVNVGDLLTRWSYQRLRSTAHRVINMSGRERLSLVLAYDPDFDTVIEPSVFCVPNELPAEPSTTCGDYLLWRFQKAFSYRRTSTER